MDTIGWYILAGVTVGLCAWCIWTFVKLERRARQFERIFGFFPSMSIDRRKMVARLQPSVDRVLDGLYNELQRSGDTVRGAFTDELKWTENLKAYNASEMWPSVNQAREKFLAARKLASQHGFSTHDTGAKPS